jgi:hypothetical protein
VFQRCQGVGGLAALGDGDDQGARVGGHSPGSGA